MPDTNVLKGQTWTDIALQELGDEQRLFELCDLNEAGITDDIVPGAVVNVPELEVSKKQIVNILRLSKPASE